jgi:hypothetical protein
VTPQPTTPAGHRALADVDGPRSRAKSYFAELMGSELTSEMCFATRVVWALEGHELDARTRRWLEALTVSFDVERRLMAAVALGLIRGDGRRRVVR